MRLPNLLSSTRGRLAALFLLYTTEGVPLLLYARRWVPALPAAAEPLAQAALALVPLLAATWLWRSGGRRWPGVR